jgi:hypothetical protein
MMMTTTRSPGRLAILLTMAVLLIVLSACAAPRPTIDFDPGVDFRKYTTYQWTPADAVGLTGLEDPRVSPVARERMRLAIDQALLARGYVKAAPPDFLVALRTDMRDRQYVDHWGPFPDPWFWGLGYRHRPFGYYGMFGYDPFFGRTTVRTVTEGTVAVDMFDAGTKQPIWHGHASRVVARDDIHPADIQRMVNAVLADFPPGPPSMGGPAGVPPPQ